MPRYVESTEVFINPYNFVPVNLDKTSRDDITKLPEQTSLVTGYMECILKCRTALAIPGERKPESEGKEHAQYEFFSIDGKPIIPGSSIRGVIRNVYETLTDSCFGTMRKDTKITERVKKALRPGLLVRYGDNGQERWELHKAERYLIVIDERFYYRKKLENIRVHKEDREELRENYRTGDRVRYNTVPKGENGEVQTYKRIGAYANINENGEKAGYICIGETTPNRHFQSIFEDKGDSGIEVGDDDFARLETILKMYRNKKINKQYGKGEEDHKGYEDYEEAKRNGVIPVYYSKEEAAPLYLSFAALGRKAFIKTLNDKAREKSHQKCDSRKNLCPACALFGTTEGEKAAGKVRFTDAVCINYDSKYLQENVTFQELASPHMSYSPFYLRKRGNSSEKADYSQSYDSECLDIRGRKFYWHHRPVLKSNIKKNDKNKKERYDFFDVIKENAVFKFRIYFENISEEEQLHLLATAVNLGENDIGGKYCHKFGHGKPLGFGSAKMVIEKCMIRKCETQRSGEGSWKEELYELGKIREKYECSKETYESLRTICDFYALSSMEADIEYPSVHLDPSCERREEELKKGKALGINDAAPHKWFSENYGVGNRPPKQFLPEIVDEDRKLYKYMVTVIYQAKVIEKTEESNADGYSEYKIEILGTQEFRNKQCVVRTARRESLRIESEIQVMLVSKQKWKTFFDVFYG